MTKTKITDEYIGGLLETKGCFFLSKKKYLMFKIIMKNNVLLDMIMKHLKKNHDISYSKMNNIYQISNSRSIKILLDFFDNFNYRDDYKRFYDVIKSKGKKYNGKKI